MAYNHGHGDFNTTAHFNVNAHVEQRRQVANAKQPEAKAEETNESKSTTDETLKQQTDCALDAFHNNNYGSKVCHPPICHSHMEACGGYTSCENQHLLNRFSLCGQPTMVCCPHCNVVDYSHVHSQAGTSTCAWMCFVGLISACLLSWVPCFCRACKDHHHICSHCGMILAYDRKC